MRGMVDLRVTRIKYSNRVAAGENFIQLQNKDDTILMAFESVVEFDKWAICFQNQQRLITESFQRSQVETASVLMPSGKMLDDTKSVN